MKNPMFFKIGIPEIFVRLFEIFQNLTVLQVWCLAFTKNFKQSELSLDQIAQIVLGVKYAKNRKIQ